MKKQILAIILIAPSIIFSANSDAARLAARVTTREEFSQPAQPPGSTASGLSGGVHINLGGHQEPPQSGIASGTAPQLSATELQRMLLEAQLREAEEARLRQQASAQAPFRTQPLPRDTHIGSGTSDRLPPQVGGPPPQYDQDDYQSPGGTASAPPIQRDGHTAHHGQLSPVSPSAHGEQRHSSYDALVDAGTFKPRHQRNRSASEGQLRGLTLQELAKQEGEDGLAGTAATKVREARAEFANLQRAWPTFVAACKHSLELRILNLVSAQHTTPPERGKFKDALSSTAAREKKLRDRQSKDQHKSMSDCEVSLNAATSLLKGVGKDLAAAQTKITK